MAQMVCLLVSAADRARLAAVVADRNRPQKHVARARIILASAERLDVAVIAIDPPGLGLPFPKLDADLYLPALLNGVFGSKVWTAARMGQEGGKARTPAKQAASRANGRLGGRPRKTPMPVTLES